MDNEEGECSKHPCAPHGFNRNASHNEDRYVCDCEGWSPDRTCAGLALLAEVERLKADAARLDYIERTFSGMTNRERYLPVQMIWGKGCIGGARYMARMIRFGGRCLPAGAASAERRHPLNTARKAMTEADGTALGDG